MPNITPPTRPGLLGNVRFRVSMSFMLVLIVIVAAWVYQTHSAWQNTMNFLGVGFAMVATVLSAYYIGYGLQITIQQREEGLRSERVSRAFSYINAWDDADLSQSRHIFREIVESRGRGVTLEKLREEISKDAAKERSLLDVLNFFEGFALAVNLGLADEESLRRCFRDIVEKAFSGLEDYIRQKRAESTRPHLFEEFETVAKRWREVT